MRTLVVLAAAREIVGRLNPSAFESKISEYRRGGLPGQSFSDGRGGGQGVPMLDKTDKVLRRAQKDYRGHARRMLVEAQAMERLENTVLLVHVPAPEEMSAFCERPDCTNLLEEGRTKGECSTHRAQKTREKARITNV